MTANTLKCSSCGALFFTRELYVNHLLERHPDEGMARLLKMRLAKAEGKV